MIVPGSRSQALAAALATTLDDTLAVPEFDRFPDGETFAAVPATGADTPERAGHPSIKLVDQIHAHRPFPSVQRTW